MKRILVLGAGIAAVVVVGIAGAAGSPSSGLDRKGAAQQILKVHGKYLTAPARAALHMVASDDRQFVAPQEALHGGARSGGLAAGPAAPFTNVRVNDPALDSHQVDQTTQSETSVAVAGSKVAVGYNDSQRTGLFLTAGSSISGYSYSTDGGASFTDGGALPNAPEFVNLGDPWLTSDRAGNMYYSTLANDAVNLNLDVAVEVDRRREDVERSGAGHAAADRHLLLRRQGRDGKRSEPEQTGEGQHLRRVRRLLVRLQHGGVQHRPARCAVDRRRRDVADQLCRQVRRQRLPGLLLRAVHRSRSDRCQRRDALRRPEKISADDPDCTGVQPTFSEWIFKSTNGGQTFGPGVHISDVTTSVPDGLLKLGPGQYMRNLEFPTIAFLGSALYVAWNDGASGHSHIRLAKSTDGGQTWSVSSATQGSNDELQPSLTGDSALHLLYYRRNNNNTLDVFVANSTNGSGFPATRVTTVSSPGVFTIPQFDPIIAFGYMGDYIGSATNGTNQYFAWGDNRDTVTNFMWPNGRHDPDVFFARQ